MIVQDDLHQLLDMLPVDLVELLINHPKRAQLIEVCLATLRPVLCWCMANTAVISTAILHTCLLRSSARGFIHQLVGLLPSSLNCSPCTLWRCLANTVCACRLCWTWAGGLRPGFRAHLQSTFERQR